jgi:hypothetical protein
MRRPARGSRRGADEGVPADTTRDSRVASGAMRAKPEALHVAERANGSVLNLVEK